MQFRFFTIPVDDPSAAERELNQFLASHRVVVVDRQLAQSGGRAVWAVCVEALSGDAPAKDRVRSTSASKIDYRAVLSDDDFARFVRLREWRKGVAQASGIPVYSVANNEQLAAMAVARPSSRAELANIEGFGASRLDKYGEALLALLRATEPTGDGPDSPPRTT